MTNCAWVALAAALLSPLACDSDGVTPVCTDAAASCTGTPGSTEAAASDDAELGDDAVGDSDGGASDDGPDARADGDVAAESRAAT